MKKNNKGFTLVELIVVLVILAILAAILVPALLGWIDKAREKSVTANAEAAFVATQGLLTEKYGTYENTKSTITFDDVNKLADIKYDSTIAKPVISYTTVKPYAASVKTSKDCYKIATFKYTEAGGKYIATWVPTTGGWTVTKPTP